MIFYVFYNFCLLLAFPLIFLRLIWRGIRHPHTFASWPNRFGRLLAHPEPHGVWLQAVSMGETIAIAPFIKQLRLQFPTLPIYLTNHTHTGATQAQKLFGETIFQAYLPYDYPWLIRRFLRVFQPRLLVLVESELWPNLIRLTHQANIPIIVVNARLSPRSFQRYQRFPHFTKTLLKQISHFAVQSEEDKRRFHQLGVMDQALSYTGNLKLMLQLPHDLSQRAKEWREFFSRNAPLWIAASTHPGEEEIILNAHRMIQQHFPKMRLLLVPRHPERFNAVFALCEKLPFITHRRSAFQNISETTDVIIGDSMGELLEFYAASDIAFVGGSLVPIGGHSVLEPAAIGMPILSGQHYFKNTEITEQLLAEQALYIVHNATELAAKIVALMHDPALRQALSAAAKNFVAKNQTSLEKTMAVITPYISNK